MGLTINVQMNVTCGANPTLNLNALGIRPIVGGNGSGAKAGELVAGRLVKLTFSTANNSWLIMSQSAGALQVSPGLDLIHAPQIQQVQSSAFNYAPDTGSTAVANSYKCAFSPAITAITDGLALSFRAATTNTAVSSVTFEVAGRKLVILDVQGNALLPGAIKAGSMYSIIYSSSSDRWYMQTAIPAAPIPDANGQVAGIVTLSDSVNDATKGVDQGYAATPKAVAVKMSKGILLGTTNLDSLDKPISAGFYLQQQDGNATLANNYPVTQAGTLLVTDGPYGTMQEYTTYASGKKFLRSVVNGLVFRAWTDITPNRFLPGQIVQMALPVGSPPPPGLLIADGSNLGRANYPALFAVIGTTWNMGGESSSTYAIPNVPPRAALLSANGLTTPLAGESRLLYTNGAIASHTHAATTSSAGSHTHTAWSDPAGIHTHPGATTNVTGEHTHPLTNAGYYRYAGNDLLGATQGAGNTGPSGSHSHTVNIPNDGGHSHSIGINDSGAHVHPVTVSAAGVSGSSYYNTPVNVAHGVCFMTFIAY
jgi:microcystin-dependent protein